MRKFILYILVLFSLKQLHAQPDTTFVCRLMEESAEFPGGTVAMQKYLAANMMYPAEAREQSISEKVYLKFTVSEKGIISNIEVLKDIKGCGACSTEAVRLIEQMPAWKPAKFNNKPVKSYFNLPVKFAIQ